MTYKKIVQILKCALETSRKVEVTLKQESIRQVFALLLMSHSGYISIGSGDQFVLMAVFSLNDWEGDENRTAAFTLTEKFSENVFIARMGRAIESIKVIQ